MEEYNPFFILFIDENRVKELYKKDKKKAEQFIKSTYKTLSRLFHPDKVENTGDKNAEIFNEITEAYKDLRSNIDYYMKMPKRGKHSALPRKYEDPWLFFKKYYESYNEEPNAVKFELPPDTKIDVYNEAIARFEAINIEKIITPIEDPRVSATELPHHTYYALFQGLRDPNPLHMYTIEESKNRKITLRYHKDGRKIEVEGIILGGIDENKLIKTELSHKLLDYFINPIRIHMSQINKSHPQSHKMLLDLYTPRRKHSRKEIELIIYKLLEPTIKNSSYVISLHKLSNDIYAPGCLGRVININKTHN